MTKEDPQNIWRNVISNLSTWKRGSQRAPHKPLLLLMLIHKAQNNQPRETKYEDIHVKLTRLLQEFGPPRKSYHTEFPFWYLQTSEIWKVKDSSKFKYKKGGYSPTRKELIRLNATGMIGEELWDTLSHDESLQEELAQQLLENFWPPTLHESIRDAIGLPDKATAERSSKRKRDPDFRLRILRAYERRCAICGYDGRLGNSPLALEAAHVQWHACGGPDDLSNGLALCSFHHVALDTGALGITENYTIQISADTYGQTMTEELLHRFHGQKLRLPQQGLSPIADKHVRWHQKQVFRTPSRL